MTLCRLMFMPAATNVGVVVDRMARIVLLVVSLPPLPQVEQGSLQSFSVYAAFVPMVAAARQVRVRIILSIFVALIVHLCHNVRSAVRYVRVEEELH